MVQDYHPTCVDAVGVFSADGVEIVADDGEPRIICMLEFSTSYILPFNSLQYFLAMPLNWLFIKKSSVILDAN